MMAVPRGQVPSPGAILAPRELEYLRRKAMGETMVEISHSMGVSISTVKLYLVRSHRKLGVQSAIDAFRVLGWLKVPK